MDDGWSGMEMTPAVEMSPLENTADGGRTETSRLSNLIGGAQLTTQGDDLSDQLRGGLARAMERPRGTIAHAGQTQGAVAAEPLGGGFSGDVERGCSRAQRHPLDHDFLG